MGSLLILIGFGAFVVGIVSMLQPIEKLHIHNRKSAGMVLAASFFVMTAGVVIRPGSPTTDAAPTAADTATTTTTQPTTTTTQATTTTALVTTTTQPPATTTTEVVLSEDVIDELYLLTVRAESASHEEVTWVDLSSDEVLIAVAHEWCAQFEDGNSFETVSLATLIVLQDIYGDGLVDADIELAAFAIGAAVGGYCPEHTNRVGIATEA